MWASKKKSEDESLGDCKISDVFQMHALSVVPSVKSAHFSHSLFSSTIKGGWTRYPHWNLNNRTCVQPYLRLASPSKSSYSDPFMPFSSIVSPIIAQIYASTFLFYFFNLFWCLCSFWSLLCCLSYKHGCVWGKKRWTFNLITVFAFSDIVPR